MTDSIVSSLAIQAGTQVLKPMKPVALTYSEDIAIKDWVESNLRGLITQSIDKELLTTFYRDLAITGGLCTKSVLSVNGQYKLSAVSTCSRSLRTGENRLT